MVKRRPVGLWKRLTQVRVGPVELRLTGGRDKSIPLPEQTPYSAGQWRTFLRARNVVTLLAVAGLMLSIAALLVLVGIGETQIVASESPVVTRPTCLRMVGSTEA
jgi:hypothetical protein